ncbi:arsenate reductase/protein-tyrosine-phosphatase family protein [Microbacterium marinilacus]|uniref:arsenate reductase/protein-tyrosine-phosphatase family protein n=1 Tax=Microbacterium marinilacus TaxID=415209 RepID=UPI0027E170D6|nr:low molecular weight phosphatase family protein [Microbacterium marinilacus]
MCTGNVCRSPLAEALLREAIGSGAQISSAGVRALAGEGMTPETRRLAGEHGVPPAGVEGHVARQLTEQMLHESDLVLAMAREHRRRVVELDPGRLRVTFTARELERLVRDVPDAEIAEELAGERDPRTRLRLALAYIASLRHLSEPPADPADDDVLDPYGRSGETYEESAAQLVPALEQIARVLRVVLAPDAR